MNKINRYIDKPFNWIYRAIKNSLN